MSCNIRYRYLLKDSFEQDSGKFVDLPAPVAVGELIEDKIAENVNRFLRVKEIMHHADMFVYNYSTVIVEVVELKDL